MTLGDHVEIASVVRTPDLERDASRLCIGADSIESNSGTFLHCPTVQEVSPRSGKYWFEANDVLYSKIRPYLAKAAIARTSGYCSADMYPLRCNRSIEPSFLLHLLLSKAFTDFAAGESVRAQMPKLNRETLFGFRFPLPPTTRQSQFSELASRVEAIRDQHAFALAKCESSFTALLTRAFAVGANGLK